MRILISGGGKAQKWGCKKCGRGSLEEQKRGELMRIGRGCDNETNNVFYSFAPKLKRCPWSQPDPVAESLASAWFDFHELQALPYAGTLLQQPARIYQSIILGNNIISELKEAANDGS